MLRKLIAAACFALCMASFSPASNAQTANLVTTCGTQNIGVPGMSGLFIDHTGNLCTNASGGGGGAGDASAANQTTQITAANLTNTNLGALGSTVCATDTGSCNINALFQRLLQQMTTLNGNVTASIPAGTALIGKVGFDQTTPGTTNLVALTPAHVGAGATGAAPPANASYMGTLSGSTAGGLTTGVISCDSTAIYDASTSGSTELVALAGTKVIYVCGYSIIAGGTVNVKLITGTGTACATGSSNKTPAYQLVAQAGIADGAPFFRGLKTAAGGALCINASGGVAAQAIVYYAQF